jgi:serine phosphatase RsbU (regulator of sigma subunit)
MSRPTLQDLIRLPEEAAIQAYFDGENTAILRRLMVVLAAGAVVGVIGFLGASHYLRAGLWFLGLLAVLAVFLSRTTRFYERNARVILMAILVVVMLVVVLSFDEPDPSFAFAGFLFPALLIPFRMRPREYLALATVFSAAAAWFVFGAGMVEGTGERIGIILSQISMAAIAVAISVRISRRKRERFQVAWRHELERETESTRMRSELHDAREIQLSMLPKTAPDLDWLDYSSISLPASEVGGDYFEYFVLSDTQLVIAIGDVAGHGVASGLVLSGVRSGLHLLRERLTEPLEVLRDLNRMIRETAPVRMFVTLQLTVLDYRLKRLTVANAGHPPLLRVSASAAGVEALGSPGLPLGTGLEPGLSTVSEPMEVGDTLIFYTDGVPEIRDFRGESYGEERLIQEVRRAARYGSARRIRDSILNSVSSFKADVAQEDDLTLLLLKIR